MTITLPLRLMILHFSHMGLTDGLTFISVNLLLMPDGPESGGGKAPALLGRVISYLLRQVMRPLVRS